MIITTYHKIKATSTETLDPKSHNWYQLVFTNIKDSGQVDVKIIRLRDDDMAAIVEAYRKGLPSLFLNRVELDKAEDL